MNSLPPYTAAQRAKYLLTRPSSSNRRTRLGVQQLEDRVTPATFTVTNTDNAGLGSLRQAVLDANKAKGTDEIVFDSLFGTAQTIIPDERTDHDLRPGDDHRSGGEPTDRHPRRGRREFPDLRIERHAC